MSVNLSLFAGAGWQFFDNNGVPLAGGLLYTYASGTTTPQTTYTTSAGTVAHPNPIVLNSAGRSANEIWLTEGVEYKFVLKTAVAVQIGSYDNISGANDLSSFSTPSGSSLIGFLQAGTGAVASTVQAKLRQTVSVKDFGAVGDGVTDDTAAIQAAINTLSALGGDIVFPTTSANVYLISDTLLLTNFIRLTFVNNVALQLADNSNVSILSNADFVNGNVGIEIYGGIFNSNKGNQNANFSTLNFFKVENCIFRGCYVLGSYTVGYAPIGAFHIEDSTLCLIENCIVVNAGSEGLYIINSTHCKIIGGEYFNQLFGSGCATNVGGYHTFIGVYSHNNDGTNFSMNGNNISLIGCISANSTLQGGIVFGHTGDPSSYSRAIGCRVDGNNNKGIIITAQSVGVIVSGNTISNTYGADNIGIILGDNSKDCVISNNIVFGGYYGIYVSQADKGSVVEGNFVFENDADGISIVLGTQNCTVTNNICKNNGLTTTGHGIYIDPDSDNNAVTGNRCYDDQAVKTQNTGLVANGDYNLASDNILFGNAANSMVCSATTIVSKNVLTASAQLNFSVTLAAGTTTTVTNGNILAVSDIAITPTSANAVTRAIYKSAQANGSVTLTHSAGGAADTVNFTIG